MSNCEGAENRDRPSRHAVSALTWGLIIAAATVLAYSNSFDKSFLFDDLNILMEYPPACSVAAFELNRRCVTSLTFALNHAAGGFNVAGYHAVNLLIHVLAALVLFGVVRRTLLLDRFRARLAGWVTPLSALTACIWAVHPLQTQSVTYVCQRYESMMGLCFLGFMYCSIRSFGSIRTVAWRAGALAWFVLGLGSKEIMAVAPFVLLVYDQVFMSGSLKATLRARWKWYLALGLVLAVYCWFLFREIGRQAADPVGAVLFLISPWEYLLTQMEVITHYLRLAFWPHPLCLDYAWPPVARLGEVAWQAAFIGILFAATCVGVVRRRAAGFAGAWFFLILAPTSSVLPLIDIAFEHRMYLPLAAVVVLVVAGGGWAMASLAASSVDSRRQAPGRAYCAFLAVVAIACAFGTYARNKTYASVEVMWRDVVRARPDNHRQHISLVHALLSSGQVEEAETQTRDLLRRLDEELAGGNSRASLVQRAQYYYAAAVNALGCILMTRNNYNEAVEVFSRISASASNPLYNCNLATAMYKAGRTGEARTLCEETARKWPTSAKAHALLGYFALVDGREKDAVGHYRKAIELSPDSMPLKLDLARFLACASDRKLRDGKEALRLACEVDAATGGSSFRASEVLAAAWAETGNAGVAVRAMERAIAGLRSADVAGDIRESLMQEFERQMDDYRNGHSFRNEKGGLNAGDSTGPGSPAMELPSERRTE